MLYIFSVDQGTMLTFEMECTYQSVEALKGVISSTQSIPEDKQVLLISGGECLSDTRIVASYAAGTDTNPIFLFNKRLYVELQPPQSPELQRHHILANPHAEKQEALLLEKLEQYCSMDPSMATLTFRTNLAGELVEYSIHEAKLTREKVHEQHLQQQAWSAVIANLEDAAAAFSKRATKFLNSFEQFVARQRDYQTILDNFPEDSKLLARVPLLSKLAQPAPLPPPLQQPPPPPPPPACSGSSSSSSSGGGAHGAPNSSSSEGGLPATLLDYVMRSDPNSSLELLAENCRRGLAQINAELLDEMRKGIQETLEKAAQPQFKRIKGLEERLSGLEDLMQKAERLANEQNIINLNLLRTLEKANSLKESERLLRLPELCGTNPRDLKRLYSNYSSLKDITRRCSSSKDELSNNIRYRLSYITRSEVQIGEFSTRLAVYEKRIEQLARDLCKVEQIHSAPQIYARSVAEVVRRKRFSSVFLKWAGALSAHCKEVYRAEIAQRRAYKEQTRSHFLRALFPGLDDVPPPYATSSPATFDDRLPPVELADVEHLKRVMPPDLAGLLECSTSGPSLSLMDVDNISHSASDISKKTAESDTGSHQEVRIFDMPATSSPADPGYVTDNNSNNVVMEVSVEKVAASGGGTAVDCGTAGEQKMCVDITHCEVQRKKLRECVTGLRNTIGAFATDTSELAHEVTRWTGELAGDASKVAETVVSLMQGAHKKNEQLERLLEIEQHKLKDAHSELEIYYDQLRQLKELLEHSKQEMRAQSAEYESRLTKLQMEHELEFENAQEKHAQEIRQLEGRLTDFAEEVRLLRHEREDHASQLSALNAEWTERVAKLREEFAARELSVREDLERQHKSEVDSLRCRYRLTASIMSTSSGTLGSDGGSSPPMPISTTPPSTSSEIENRWKLREMELLERIRQLDKSLEEKHNSSRASPSAGTVCAMEMDSGSTATATTTMMASSQMIQSMSPMAESTVSCFSLGNTISGMAESAVVRISPNGNSEQPQIQQQQQVQYPLTVSELMEQLRAKEAELQRLQTHLAATGTLSSLSSDRVSILSCSQGDVVLLAYDDNHENYVIFMLGPHLHFLHKDSLEALRLSTDRERSSKRWIVGEVVEKDFCEAKKSVNRYKLAAGTRFFRVKVRPWDRNGAMRREQERRQAARAAATATAAIATGVGPQGAQSPSVSSTSPAGISSPVASPATSI